MTALLKGNFELALRSQSHRFLVKGHHLLPIYVHPNQHCTQSHRSSMKGHHLQPIHIHASQHCVLKVIARQSRAITYILSTSITVSTMCSRSSLVSQGPSLTPYSRPSQSALCTQVIALRSRVITYILTTSIPVSTVYSKSPLFGQGSSLTSYPRPSQSALYTQSHRSSVKGHHVRTIHVHPSQHYILKVIALRSRVITYILSTSIPVSTVYSKSSLFGQGSSLTFYPRPSSQHCVLKVTVLRSRVITYALSTSIQSALYTQNHRSSVKGHDLLSIHIHLNQH
jgi:hypothetical protein